VRYPVALRTSPFMSEEVPVVIDGVMAGRIPVADVLP
jgi:hypothetical protein